MRQIGISGTDFTIDGVARPYVFATSFCLLGHYQSDPEKGRAWLERIKELGFDGPRFFGENEDWFPHEGGGFFGNSQYTTLATAFGPGVQYGSSSISLVPGYIVAIASLVEDLEDLDLVGEMCCIATVKGRDESVSSHGLNRFAQLMRGMQTDSLIYEAVNEWNAHSQISESEAMRYGARWRRSSDDPGHHNYPGSYIGISGGGGDAPVIDDNNYTHRNIHPHRGPRWAETDFARIKQMASASGFPVALNETIHVMSQKDWDKWTPTQPSWGNLSTTDHTAAVDYLKRAVEAGISVTAHYLEGMSTDPDLPISEYEQAIQLWRTGANSPPRPAPTPTEKLPYAHVVDLAFKQILERSADKAGLEAWNKFLSGGGTEQEMRNALLRSQEFIDKYVTRELPF